MRTLYIIKTGSTFAHIRAQHQDFEHWIAAGLKVGSEDAAHRPDVAIIDATACAPQSPAYPSPQQCAGVVISGSHDMVTDNAPWMQTLQQWLLQICEAGVPVLGICFGHQLLAQTLGGQVGPHPRGLELGTVPVSIQTDVSQDPLWRYMPPCFDAHVVHYQSVRRLPQGACLLAGNSHEPHQAFRWRSNVWGVQFHPEFAAHAMQAYIDYIKQQLSQQMDAQSMVSLPSQNWRCSDTPDAAQLLHHFARHVCQQSHATASRQPDGYFVSAI